MSVVINEKDLNDIIVAGDAVVLVNKAQMLGTQLAKDRLTKTQIRNVFGEVRKIEAQWSLPQEDNEQTEKTKDNVRRLLLLKPRMKYQATRERRAEPLLTVLASAIDKVVLTDSVPQSQYKRFGYFVEFFEAILAYHTAEGGK